MTIPYVVYRPGEHFVETMRTDSTRTVGVAAVAGLGFPAELS